VANHEERIMPSRLATDQRLDPRIKAMFGWDVHPLSNVSSRDELIAIENSDTGKAAAAALKKFLDKCDN
jgi:hypothetical protein